MGLENRELISRLEKIGIAVKSHSSTLEDDDLERIQAELLAPEAREVVEKRIKSTVIRRRAVRMPVEESKPEELAAEPETEAPSDAPPPLADAVPAEVVRKTAPKGSPGENVHLPGCACRRRRSKARGASGTFAAADSSTGARIETCDRKGGPNTGGHAGGADSEDCDSQAGSPGDRAKRGVGKEAGSRNRFEGP